MAALNLKPESEGHGTVSHALKVNTENHRLRCELKSVYAELYAARASVLTRSLLLMASMALNLLLII